MELGFMWESEASGPGRGGPVYVPPAIIRSACAEFLGMVLFLFAGEPQRSTETPSRPQKGRRAVASVPPILVTPGSGFSPHTGSAPGPDRLDRARKQQVLHGP